MFYSKYWFWCRENHLLQDETRLHEESEPEQEVFIHQSHPPVYPSVYIPYIEGPKMDWMVNDALYHRFLKCKLKCEDILECELAALPECQKCKKVIAWSGDCEMDQYVSWGLSKEKNKSWHNLGEAWKLCKLQSNEVWTQFDLLTSFCQGNESVDELYNAVQVQMNLTKYCPETLKILHWDIFWSFLWDEDFVSRTITGGSVNLDKFPTSRVRQLAKKLESSKATAHHIKQVANDPQVTQINLLWHQRMELQTTRHNKKRKPVGMQRQSHYKTPENQVTGQVKRHYDNKIVYHSKDRCSKCGDSTHIKGFDCPAKNYQCKVCQ